VGPEGVAGPDTIYKHAKGALLKKTFSKKVSYTDITISSAKGKKLVYDTPPIRRMEPPVSV
jgi:hypothetical protein